MTATLAKTTLATNEATVTKAEADGVKLLGFDVTWSLRGVAVERARLGELLTEQGYGSFLPAAPPAVAVTLKRAIVLWLRQRGKPESVFVNGLDEAEEVIGRAVQIEKLKIPKGSAWDTPGAVIFGIVQKEDLSSINLRFALSHRFYYLPGATKEQPGTITVTAGGYGSLVSVEAAQAEREIAAIWERQRLVYTKAEVGALVTEIVEDYDSYRLRDEGGAYHVPLAYARDLDRLTRFIAALPGSDRWGRTPRLNAHAIPDWPGTRAALEEQAFDNVLASLKEAKWKLDRHYLQNEQKPGSVRPRTAQIIVTMLNEVRRKADLVVEQVGMRRERVAALETDLTAMMDQATALLPSEDRPARDGQREMQADLADLDLPEETRTARLS